nr:MAG TPA: hypothetical protein [Caudoviricetes sp.]
MHHASDLQSHADTLDIILLSIRSTQTLRVHKQHSPSKHMGNETRYVLRCQIRGRCQSIQNGFPN